MKDLSLEIANAKIENFFKTLNTEINIIDYVTLENINYIDSFYSIVEMIESNCGFDIEIIYYTNAIEYLQKNDPSLKDSIDLAIEYGHDLQNINSEVLASLLASCNAREQFNDLESEINEFFNNLNNDLSN